MLTTLTGLILICLTGGFRVENTLSPGFITLYENSEVVNIYDSNIYSLYNSDTLWLVQFYNHWCGHCQRFAPIWKALAEDILDWAPIVKIAAINCADQSCDRYQVTSSKTIHKPLHSHHLSPDQRDSDNPNISPQHQDECSRLFLLRV